MNLHEYQAKNLLKQYGLAVPASHVAYNADEILQAARQLGGERWVIKAQVHAGGRGKAGGVKIVSSLEDLAAVGRDLLGKRLVTYQTDARGQPVNAVLVEAPSAIERELYLGAVIDRSLQRLVIMASDEGGVEIEKVAETHPEKIYKIVVDPVLGVLPYQARELSFKLRLDAAQAKQLSKILVGIAKLFAERDLSLLEINPLVVVKSGELLCLDAKITLDDNALYRQEALHDLRDITQEDERENQAKDWGLSYIALDGDIGCMVNGAGLAMATMDLIKLHGGEPANFLDVGGSATTERVREAFKIILSDSKVKAVLVNIFGGIVRCDLIAEGIINAVKEVGIKVPVVVRLQGNNAELGGKMLTDSKLNLIAANGLTDAAQKVVQAARGVK